VGGAHTISSRVTDSASLTDEGSRPPGAAEGPPVAVRVDRRVRHLRLFDETQDKNEQYSANGRHDDGAEQAPT
jgi:hypothetical protein